MASSRAGRIPVDWPQAGSVQWWIAEFGLGDDTTDGGSENRLVLVPVGDLDVRAVRPVEHAWRAAARERRAVHVVVDEDAASRLAREWMRRGLSFPLFFVEDEGGIAETIARVVLVELAAGFDEVVVLVGRLALRRRIHRLLHDRTADAIGRRVYGIPAVQVGLMNVAVY